MPETPNILDQLECEVDVFVARAERAAAGEFDQHTPSWLMAYANGMADAVDRLRRG